jgi:putative membrane protein
MLGCNYYGNIPFIGFLVSRGIFSLIFWSLIVFTIIFFIKTVSRKNEQPKESITTDRNDSLEILKMRYAKGEINNEEFNKMKHVLL